MSRATDLHKLITSIQDRHEVSESEESQFPYLGLFYVIFEELYWEGTPIKYAEDSSHFKIYPKIHLHFGPIQLSRINLNSINLILITFHGAVSFMTKI